MLLQVCHHVKKNRSLNKSKLMKPQKGARFTRIEAGMQQNQEVTNKKNLEPDFLRDDQN